MFRHLTYVMAVSLLAATATVSTDAQVKAGTTNLPSEDTVNGFLQQTFAYNSSLSWKIQDIKPSAAQGLAEVTVLISSPQGQQVSSFFVTADGQHAVLGEVIPFGARPFEPARLELEKGTNGPSRGPADAPVTLVEFSDLQCPHCKEAQPTIEKLMSEEKNVRLVFQNYPLPSHDWAAKAAYFADCIGREAKSRDTNGSFWKFIQSVYDAQADISAANADEKLKGLADAAGTKSADAAACAAKPDTARRVEHSLALGRAVDVSGTPTLFINGRKIANVGGIPYDALKSIVEFSAKEVQDKKSK
ncbi:MAG: hypothetical protein NVS1B11_05850 [Terriglobales bacterium]